MVQLPDQVMIIALVTIVGLAGLIFWFTKNKSKQLPDHERHIMELIIREQEKNKRLGQRLEVTENEIASIKNQLNELAQKKHHQHHDQTQGFNNNLQRQSFLHKNRELVLLLQDGLSIEKVAKASNRSVREVELVESVLRQQTNL